MPLLFCPPWINKYYIMDLAPGKSLIEWAVQHGHTCFAISYRNPDASMRDLDFEDYLHAGPAGRGPGRAGDHRGPEVNTLSVCLGGTLTAIGAGPQRGDRRRLDQVRHVPQHPHRLQRPRGRSASSPTRPRSPASRSRWPSGATWTPTKMAHTFDALRANDLVFAYVVNNWLLGKKPPAFDLLVWNKDSTRMPAKMHSRYLRSCYLHNEFAQRRVRGRRPASSTRARSTSTPTCCRAVDDHIVPWVSGYKTTQLLGGRQPVRAQHLRPHRRDRQPAQPEGQALDQRRDLPADPQEWKDNAELQTSTWWEDWATWIAKQGGPKVAAPRKLGSKDHPPIEDAPGSYVRYPRVTFALTQALTPTILTSPATAGTHSTDQRGPS